MNTSEFKLIERASGARTVNALAEVAVEPDRGAWIRLAFAVTMAVFQEIRLSPEIAAVVQGLWVKAGYGPPKPHAPCDAYIAVSCLVVAQKLAYPYLKFLRPAILNALGRHQKVS